MMNLRGVSIDDYYRVFKCPAKLLLKLTGVKLPSYSKKRPKVSPNKLGAIGEKIVFDAVVGGLNITVPEQKMSNLEVEEVSESKYLKWILSLDKKRIREELIDLLFEVENTKKNASKLNICLSLKKDKFLGDLKSKYNLEYIIPQIRTYNVAYHYTGQIDFLGLTKDGEIKLIEVKNAARLPPQTPLQVSLYLHSMNKRFIAATNYFLEENDLFADVIRTVLSGNTKIKSPTFLDFIVTMLFKKNKDHLRAYLVNEIAKHRLVQNCAPTLEFLETLMELEHFTSGDTVYYPLSEELLHRNYQKVRAFIKKVQQIKEYSKAKEVYNSIFNDVDDSFKELSSDLKEILKSVQDALDTQPDSAIIINVRQKELKEITEPVADIDYLSKVIWFTKRNALTNNLSSLKNKASCGRCPYYLYCEKIEKVDDIDKNTKSAVVLVDKGLDKILSTKKWSLNFSNSLRALRLLKENPKFLPRESKQWGEDKNLAALVNSSRQYVVSKGTSKFDRELKFWF